MNNSIIMADGAELREVAGGTGVPPGDGTPGANCCLTIRLQEK